MAIVGNCSRTLFVGRQAGLVANCRRSCGKTFTLFTLFCSQPLLRFTFHWRRQTIKKEETLIDNLRAICFLKIVNGPYPASFSVFSSFQCNWNAIKFADYWIRTTEHWSRKQPLTQLSCNDCQFDCSRPLLLNVFIIHWHKVIPLSLLTGVKTILGLWCALVLIFSFTIVVDDWAVLSSRF